MTAARAVGFHHRLVVGLQQSQRIATQDLHVNRTAAIVLAVRHGHLDRKSTRLNSSHEWISYAVFCLKKKKKQGKTYQTKPEPYTNSLQHYRTVLQLLHANHHA